jgi:opacity protein-like surface antigen
LAYWWGVKTSDEVPAEVVAVNMEPLSPVTIIVPPMIADQKNEMDEVRYAQPLTADVETQTAEGSDAGQQPLAEIANLHGSRDLITAYQSDTDLQIPYGVKYSKITYTEPVRYELMPDEIEMPVVERWSVTAMASPTYYSQFTSSGNDLAKQIMESDQTRVSYTGGVGLSYKLSSRLSIQSGLYYSSIGQEMSGINAYSGFQSYDNSKGGPNFEVLTASGTVTASNSDVFLSSYSLPERVITNYTNDVFDPVKASLDYVSSTLYQDLSFLELPVIVRYKVVDRKVGLNLVGGMSYNFLVNNNVYAVRDEGRYPVGTTEGLNEVSLSSSLGMGMEYKLSQNLSLNIEPTFRYYLNPFNTAKTTGTHPYAIGIFSGVAYKF